MTDSIAADPSDELNAAVRQLLDALHALGPDRRKAFAFGAFLGERNMIRDGCPEAADAWRALRELTQAVGNIADVLQSRGLVVPDADEKVNP